jgi:hypothetical protein
MHNAHLSKTPTTVRVLEKETDPFWPREEGEEVLGFEYPYLGDIGAEMYVANNIRTDIAFTVNFLARFSAAPTMQYWNRVKDVLQYLQGIPDLDLFYKKNQVLSLIDYIYARYLNDPHNSKSQTGFVFLYGGMTIL